jgi:DNA-binding transcriptional ArsR family regulator
MDFLVKSKGKARKAYKALVLDPAQLKVLSPLALRIVAELAREPSCAMDLARKLGEHEQKIYYHLRRLAGVGIVQLLRTEERVGAMAKIYHASHPYVAAKLFEARGIDVKTKALEVEFLRPFVRDGKFNSLIIIGSPDPHGKYKACASDGYCAINLCSFLGQFVQAWPMPLYKLDTQIVAEDLDRNLILLGGAKANMLVDRVNEHLPIYFNYSSELREWNIVSSLSRKVYREKQIGFIERISSPFAQGKEVLVLGGNGFRGTRSAVLAFIDHLDEIRKGNSFDPSFIARVVRGLDVDADGIVDEVEFLE